jgi:hypothetical protein
MDGDNQIGDAVLSTWQHPSFRDLFADGYERAVEDPAGATAENPMYVQSVPTLPSLPADLRPPPRVRRSPLLASLDFVGGCLGQPVPGTDPSSAHPAHARVRAALAQSAALGAAMPLCRDAQKEDKTIHKQFLEFLQASGWWLVAPCRASGWWLVETAAPVARTGPYKNAFRAAGERLPVG